MSQVDGTVNPQPGSPQFDEVVWIPDGPAWVAGGTVLILRRIRMLLDTSDIRVAHAATNRETILRRPYSYDNGMQGGTNDMGLLFAAYTSDPAASFIPMQERIASSDAFNEWNVTVGSAAYFIPSGVEIGEIIGEGIFT
jgi:dye decolorizing peroxidase